MRVTEGALKILVVDDDPDVLAIASESLAAEGYTVLQAGNAGDALHLLKDNRDTALLFTDIVMPGLDGFDLSERAKALRPDLRVLYMSAYLKDEGVWEGMLLTKPFRLDYMRDAVRTALA